MFELIGLRFKLHFLQLVSPEKNMAKDVLQTATYPLYLSDQSSRSSRRRVRSPVMTPIQRLQWYVERLRFVVLEKYADRIFCYHPVNEAASEWEWLAAILDRLCLIGSMVTVCLLGAIFMALGIFTTWYRIVDDVVTD